MLHFTSVRVASVRRETDDCVSVSFDIPAGIRPQFTYTAGQYLTIRTTIDGSETRRSYSLCSAPHENEWRIAVKRVPGGLFSNFANGSLKAGDTLDVMPPMGGFRFVPSAGAQRRYVAFAAGSGITPVISMIKTALEAEPASQFILVYGNRDRNSIIFREELEALKNRFMDRFGMVHILSREVTDAAIHSGRIDSDKCAALFGKLLPLEADDFFLCGPQAMIFCIRDFLSGHGIPRERIHFELFTTDSAPQASVAAVVAAPDAPAAAVTLKLDGRDHSFRLPFGGASILDAATGEGIDLPYSCKSGVCCTCRARLLSGEVEMETNYALEPEEVEEGFILTCQARPLTDEIVVDFDSK